MGACAMDWFESSGSASSQWVLVRGWWVDAPGRCPVARPVGCAVDHTAVVRGTAVVPERGGHLGCTRVCCGTFNHIATMLTMT